MKVIINVIDNCVLFAGNISFCKTPPPPKKRNKRKKKIVLSVWPIKC